jgi:hypothetical protein
MHVRRFFITNTLIKVTDGWLITPLSAAVGFLSSLELYVVINVLRLFDSVPVREVSVRKYLPEEGKAPCWIRDVIILNNSYFIETCLQSFLISAALPNRAMRL